MSDQVDLFEVDLEMPNNPDAVSLGQWLQDHHGPEVADPPFEPEYWVVGYTIKEGILLYLEVTHAGPVDNIRELRQFIEDTTEQWWWSLGRHDRHMRVECALGDVLQVAREMNSLLERINPCES